MPDAFPMFGRKTELAFIGDAAGSVNTRSWTFPAFHPVKEFVSIRKLTEGCGGDAKFTHDFLHLRRIRGNVANPLTCRKEQTRRFINNTVLSDFVNRWQDLTT